MNSRVAEADRAIPGIPMRRLVHVELRKLTNTRAGLWLLVSIGVVSALLMLAIVFTGNVEHLRFINIFGMLSLPTSFLLPVLAILLVTSEWSQRTGLVTFTVEPRRTRVVVAKLATSLVLVAGSVLVALALAAVGTLLAVLFREGVAHEWEMSAEVLRNAVLVQLAHLLEAFGFGMLIMSSAAAIVTFFALPTAWTVLGSSVPWLHDHVQRWLDFSAATAIFQNGEAPFRSAQAVTETQWSQLAVTTVLWVAVPVAVGAWRLVHAEVK